MNIYTQNLEALLVVDPQLAKLLQLTTTNEIFEVFLSEDATVIEANIVDNRDSSRVYNANSSTQIHEKLIKFEEYDNYPILYFFGIGNGSFFYELLKNSNHQELMVIEPEIELIYIALNLIDFSEDILNKRLVIKLSILLEKEYFMKELNELKKFFVYGYNLHIYSTFYDKYSGEIDRINKEIVAAFKYTMYIVGNSAKDALIGLEYSLKNIPTMVTTPPLRRYLTTKAKNTKTALIVSTGPSLNKQLKLLKRIQKHITILCIDASFPILSNIGIKPDIVFSIERVPLTGKFYKETPKEFHKDVIFSLATVCHDETINNIYGKKCFFMRADSYNIFFGLDKWGYMGGGQSSANFAYDFAVKSEFDNIVFIGQDLAYGKDGLSHSKNHVFGENEVKDTNIIGNIPAYGGEGEVQTTKVWSAFLNAFALQIESSKILSINATEGGARIPGTVEMGFKDVVETYLNKDIQKKKIEVDDPSQEMVMQDLSHYKKRLYESIQIGKSMRKNSEKLYKKIDLFLQDYDKNSIFEPLLSKNTKQFIKNIAEIKENYNDEKFHSMYANLLNGYIINHEYEVAKVYMMRENTSEAKLLKNMEWLKVHHEWLYRISINLDAILKLLNDAYSKLILSPKK